MPNTNEPGWHISVVFVGWASRHGRRVGLVVRQLDGKLLGAVHALEGNQMSGFIGDGDAHGDADVAGFFLGASQKDGGIIIT